MQEKFTIELKYCERCGGLWLRRHKSDQVYCASCAPEMRLMAIPRKRPAPARPAPQDLGGVACF